MIPPQALSQQFSSFSEQKEEILAVESVFGIVICGWIGQLEFFKRNAIKDIFVDNFHNIDFPNVLSRKYVKRFFWKRLVNQMNSV